MSLGEGVWAVAAKAALSSKETRRVERNIPSYLLQKHRILPWKDEYISPQNAFGETSQLKRQRKAYPVLNFETLLVMFLKDNCDHSRTSALPLGSEIAVTVRELVKRGA
jgi:hypothetical protein